MARNRETATLVFVTMPLGGGELKYGFRSRLRDSLRDNFGQTVIANGVSIQNLVIGANSPKPARASRRTETGYEGSYCSTNRIAALRADRYSITRAKPSKIQGGNHSDTYFATVNGIKVAFLSNALDSGGRGAAAGFPSQYGVRLATSADTGELVYGAEFPRLPSYSYDLEDGSVFSSKTDPSQANELLNSGGLFKEKDAGFYNQGHFAALYGVTAN
ncbi:MULTISPECIES: hypothetical protein [Cyanophyceae]|uniref:hypothetical protein n=1 Tax=Cyanophyceae TaxID=3028117 RepID=UPI00016DC97B|nr:MULTISPECIES: hypothetical protein [Cyanophyceae]ACA99859.1 conserved hypothetical protein [Picosynechococcus sp. PCC 7002]SMH55159.1 hypothetical protein SAMN06272755_2920 [Picosynechococcus sp. OG1]SMQ83173.1 hypothetical protein SAMN06272774_2196 [Synechococcus sp. 7002]